MGFLTKKIPLFAVRRIQVFLHPVWIIFAVLRLIHAAEKGYFGFGVWFIGVLFVSVLLHEFGHCWGARRMKGEAREILMWPLGGLASVEAPMTPWAQFVVTICGPLVNAILAALFFGLSYLVSPIWQYELADRIGVSPYGLVLLIYYVNVGLLVFNVIPAFPMDGGRLFQCALWAKLGYVRASTIACYASFVCAGGMVVYAVTQGGFGEEVSGILLVCIAISCVLAAYQELLHIRQGAYSDVDEPWRQTYWYEEPGAKSPGFFEKIRKQRAEAREAAEQKTTAERAQRLDDVLRRVAEVGMDGLTADERTFLDQESARLRNTKR